MYELPQITEFNDNAIGIDPEGCGCTDCIVGNSIPEDNTDMVQKLVNAHLNAGRRIINRTSSNIIVYRDQNGEGKWLTTYGYNPAVITEDHHRPVEYDEADPIIILHSEYCACDSCEAGTTIPAESFEAFEEAYNRHVDQHVPLYNESGSVLVILKSYHDGCYNIIPIETPMGDSVKVIAPR